MSISRTFRSGRNPLDTRPSDFSGVWRCEAVVRSTYGSPVMDVGERVFVRVVGGVGLVRMRA
jgi:hypothetical protein